MPHHQTFPDNYEAVVTVLIHLFFFLKIIALQPGIVA
jgi:hypothetical protein